MRNRDNPLSALDLEEKVDEAIARGIRRGQKALRRRRLLGRLGTGVAAGLLAVIIIGGFSIRVSPVFAAMVREIPGMEKFVDLIRRSHDKGVQLAVDHDLLQPVGASDEKDGIKFTVQGIIADHTRMVLFYDIEFSGEGEYAELEPAFTDVHGQRLGVSIAYNYPEESMEEVRKSRIQRGTMDVSLPADAKFPDEVVLQVRLKRKMLPDPNQPPRAARTWDEWGGPAQRGNETVGTEFQIPFRIDHAKFEHLTRQFMIHETLNIEGQKVIFGKVVLSPLSAAVHLTYPESNTKQIFDPGDIRLVDDQGIEWRQTSGYSAKDHLVLYFESPYFKKTETLYIEGSWFRALDKDKLDVLIDLDKQEIIQAPDEKLSLKGVIRTREHIRLDFELSGLDAEDRMMYSLFEHVVTDAAGIKYDEVSETGVSHSEGSDKLQIRFYLMNKPYKQPIKMTINHYPQYIRQPYKIQIR